MSMQLSSEAKMQLQDNTRMFQNVLLVWVDKSINIENNADCRNTITQLKRTAPIIDTFTDAEQCIKFINNMNKEKICLIISGSLGQHIVPDVHNLSQVDSIFIFCKNKNQHEQWAKKWSKIKGVFIEISSICEALKQASYQCEHNCISMSFAGRNSETSKNNSDHLDCSFMYTQILKEILLTIEFNQEHIEQFINYCREQVADNDHELSKVKEFAEEYHAKISIWWYTYEGFLYRILNHALRTMNVDIIIKMGFFINDLHRHIEYLHSEQFGEHQSNKTFIVYRGQEISKENFDKMMKTKGGLMAFNNFLSTSKNRDVSLGFTRRALDNPDSIGILFVLTIDPSKATTPFASINDVSWMQKEDEVLFSMNTVFRIRDIRLIDGNTRLFEVDLTLTTSNDEDLLVLTEDLRKQTEESTGWARMGKLLFEMGQFGKAAEIYDLMLKQTSDDREKVFIYNQFGRIKDSQGKYDEAVRFYENALEICRNILPTNHLDLVITYSNIGAVYCNLGESSKALWYHEEVLKINQKTLPLNHPDLIRTYDNIGLVYYNMNQYSKALLYYNKALEIKQKTLLSNHRDSANLYNHIGGVYYTMGEFSKVLWYYEKDLEICQKIFPRNHPRLGVSYNNIGIVYYNMGEHSKALSCHEKALELQQQSLPPNHPDLALSCSHIGNIYSTRGEYSKALPFCKRAADTGQGSLSVEHRHRQWYENTLEDVKRNCM